MTQSPVEEYKQRQLEFYDANAADWEKWAAVIADQAKGFNLPLIEVAGIGPGHRVLDLASGAGEPALTIAWAVGETGRVTATDLSPSMLAIVERRAAEAGFGHIAFEVAAMESLPFDDDSFDFVTSRFGFMYTPEPDRTLAEVRRVLKPGGKVALMVWGSAEKNTVLLPALETANAETGYFEDDELVHPFCFAEPNSIGSLFERAGLVAVTEQDLHFAPEIPVGVNFWAPLVGMTFGGAVAELTEENRAALDSKVAAAYEPFIEDDKYRLSAHVRIALGTEPGTIHARVAGKA